MENASKALLIAGGVLIAILILSALMITLGGASEIFKTEETAKASEQVKIFNTDYEAFNKKLLRGVEVISAINKAENNNRNYREGNIPSNRAILQSEMREPAYYISIEFEMKEEVVYTKVNGKGKPTNKKFEIGKTYTMNDYYENIQSDSEAFTDFKRRVFDCVKTGYNKDTGRINYMKFVERKMTDNEYMEGI